MRPVAALMASLAVAVALALPGTAYVQERVASPFENAAEDPSTIRLATALENMDKALEALEPQASAIRADETLSEAVRRERLLELLSREEARLDDFETALADAVRRFMEGQNATPEQILRAIEINRQHMMTGVVERFVTGWTPRARQSGEPV